jgi:BMFP domain-containing protein YqiC
MIPILRLALLTLLIAVGPATEPAPPTPAAPEVPVGEGIIGAYDEAVARLEAICEDYRRIKAIQLARNRDIAFGDAYDNISSVMPQLKPIDRQLLRDAIIDPADIVPHKRAVELVEGEVAMMVDLTAKLLLEIEQVQIEMQQQQQQQQQAELAEILQREDFDPEQQTLETAGEIREELQAELQQLEEAAREEEQEPSKDLTSLMRPLLPDIQDLTSEEQLSAEAVQMDLFSSQTGEGGVFGKIDLDTVNATTGRKVVAGGQPVEWLFVDTWYTIGPFPNPLRMNIHRKFPPETVVDLSASYIGKDEQTIEWAFVQSDRAMVVPANDEEYAIYYAYTELYFDRPMDLWVAIGSDDRGEVWLNDLPIWISSDKLKGWNVNEGFRKVSFQAGRNRVLYRIENGWRGTSFSFAIRARE